MQHTDHLSLSGDQIAATARFARHVSEQGYALDLFSLCRMLGVGDPLIGHLNQVMVQGISVLPTARAVADSFILLGLSMGGV